MRTRLVTLVLLALLYTSCAWWGQVQMQNRQRWQVRYDYYLWYYSTHGVHDCCHTCEDE
jgi:hypothetical protein